MTHGIASEQRRDPEFGLQKNWEDYQLDPLGDSLSYMTSFIF